MYLRDTNLGYVGQQKPSTGPQSCGQWERWDTRSGATGRDGRPVGACVRMPDHEIRAILLSRQPIVQPPIDYSLYPTAESLQRAGLFQQWRDELSYRASYRVDQGRAGSYDRAIYATPEHERRFSAAHRWGVAVGLIKDPSKIGVSDLIPLAMMAIPIAAVAIGAGAGAAAAGGGSGVVTSGTGAAVTSAATGGAVTTGAGVAAGSVGTSAAVTGATAVTAATGATGATSAGVTGATGAGVTGAGATGALATVQKAVGVAAGAVGTVQQAKSVYDVVDSMLNPASQTDPAFVSPGYGDNSWSSIVPEPSGLSQYGLPLLILLAGIGAAVALK